MTGIYDRAQALEQRQREAALAAFSANLPSGDSLSHCEDCAEPIPEARRRIVRGCRRCVTCQELAER
jgi:phage/conjugal plasmid C-4 type zinc finger TraR family protein